jgi:DNA-binding NarL/FixJ family response regulator
MVRMLIADDHPVVRTGLRLLLEREPDLRVVAEAATGAEAVERALAAEVDLAIVDVAMEKKTGLQAAEEIVRRRPATRVLMLSMYDSEQYLIAAARAGASGYVLKSVADEAIVASCRACLGGGGFVLAQAVSEATREQIERARLGKRDRDEVLSRRELEVLKLVAEGYSTNEIASELVISPRTVERHRANLMEKLGVGDRVQLPRHALRRGLIQP